MNSVILSGKYPAFAESLRSRGYNVISSETVDAFIPYERDHADMQCLILDDTAFVLSCCERLKKALSECCTVVECGKDIEHRYPMNVPLNAAVIGKRVIARIASLDEKVKQYCAEHGYELINVNQGYTKCSCAVVDDNALITADKGIYHSLKGLKYDVLLIEEGRVKLEGADHGFIGGASGLDVHKGGRTLYFSGNIALHPDHIRIKEFCRKHHTLIVSLTNDELIDIGGMIFC